jgi:hypothetical protein
VRPLGHDDTEILFDGFANHAIPVSTSPAPDPSGLVHGLTGIVKYGRRRDG